MLILTLRTDTPEAELGIYESQRRLKQIVWLAHRQLAETIHERLLAALSETGRNLPMIEGIVVYKGPGSFTGLRIGLTVANALAYSLQIPIVACAGNDWQRTGITLLGQGHTQLPTVPTYGALPHITRQKK